MMVDTPKSKKTVDDNNNLREKSPKTRPTKNSSKISDFKLTIITNTVWLGVIAYLCSIIYKNDSTFSDCYEHFRSGQRLDGIYEIQPDKNSDKKINVYCNMTAGGLTSLFKISENSKINFQNEYNVYKRGFGDLNTDHFLGLDLMYSLTRDKTRELIAVMNDTQYRYGDFKVLSEFYHYKLVIHEQIDKFMDESTLLRLNNSLFSTIDVDYDLAANSNCSSGWKAGWWFTDCFDHSICMTCLTMHGNKGIKKLRNAAFLIK